jgi:hypothetical protein
MWEWGFAIVAVVAACVSVGVALASMGGDDRD